MTGRLDKVLRSVGEEIARYLPVRGVAKFFVILALFIMPGAASAASPITIPLRATDLVYSPLTGLLYGSASSQDSNYANSLVVLNPANGAVLSAVLVGSDPSKLAISDDGRFLYVVYDGTAIKMYEILSTTQGDVFAPRLVRSFRVTRGSPFGIPNIKVMPGRPETIAVFLSGPQAIAIIDKGTVRPTISSDTFGNILAFESENTLWASTTIVTPNQAYKYNIDRNGIRAVDSPVFYLSPFDRSIQINKRVIYAPTGTVFDIAESGNIGFLNTDPRSTSALAIDAKNKIIYFIILDDIQNENRIVSFDLKTFRQLGVFKAPRFGGIGSQLVSGVLVFCPGAGLAVPSLETSTVTILPLSLIEPLPPYVKPAPVALNSAPRIIPLPNSHIAYDETRHMIYASVPGSAGNIGNSIVPVDPFLGSVGDAVWIGSEPGVLALSGNKEWLYAGINAASSIRRASIPDLIPGESFRVRSDGSGQGGPNPTGLTSAEMIIGLPLTGDSIVAGFSAFPSSFQAGSDGVRVFDRGVARPLSIAGDFIGGVRSFQLADDGETVYGIDPSTFFQSFITMRIRQDGIQTISQDFNITSGFHLKCQNGLCFTETGSIINASTRTLIGRLMVDDHSRFLSQVAPDVANGIVYIVDESTLQNQIGVAAYNLTTRQLIRRFEVPGVRGPVKDCFIWGGNQLAFDTNEAIVLMPLALLSAQ